MFNLVINALWSKDYLPQLAQVISDNLNCPLEEALGHIKALGEGKRRTLTAATIGHANVLACELMQFGCYTEIIQAGPLTQAAMVSDLREWFDEDLSQFRVVADASGRVSRMIEVHGYGYLRMETQGLNDWVGEELIRNGAQRVDESDWPMLNAELQKAIAENEVRRMALRAERAAEKRRRMAQGGSPEEE